MGLALIEHVRAAGAQPRVRSWHSRRKIISNPGILERDLASPAEPNETMTIHWVTVRWNGACPA
jgi:hypothetical protein